MVTLIVMSQGNPIALKRTLESTKSIVDEIIYGDLLIFQKDRYIIYEYTKEYNFKVVNLPFNWIFTHGFGNTLNLLAGYASNDWVLYLNCSEIIESGVENILPAIENNTEGYNSFAFDHSTDRHIWFRLYNKKELEWGGYIHEELGSRENRKYYPTPIFRMADTDKDSGDLFYSKVMDTVKELVYFNNYLKLIDQPHLLGNTDPGWINFAQDSYQSFINRLHAKGKMYDAFITGDFELFMNEIFSPTAFDGQKFESSILLEYQQSPMFLGKK